MASEARVVGDRRNAWKTLRTATARLLRRCAPRNDKVGGGTDCAKQSQFAPAGGTWARLALRGSRAAFVRNKANRPGVDER